MFILLALSLGSACSESTTRRSDSGPEDAAGDAQPDDASDASVSLTDAETSESDSGVSVGDAAADADVEDAQADASPVEAGVDSSVVVDAGGDDMLEGLGRRTDVAGAVIDDGDGHALPPATGKRPTTWPASTEGVLGGLAGAGGSGMRPPAATQVA